jgi:hypothetical protein
VNPRTGGLKFAWSEAAGSSASDSNTPCRKSGLAERCGRSTGRCFAAPTRPRRQPLEAEVVRQAEHPTLSEEISVALISDQPVWYNSSGFAIFINGIHASGYGYHNQGQPMHESRRNASRIPQHEGDPQRTIADTLESAARRTAFISNGRRLYSANCK